MSLRALIDYLESRRRIHLNKPVDTNNWGLDGQINKLSMFCDDEGNLIAQPVVIVDPSGTTTARAQRGVYYDRNPKSINERVDVTVIQHDSLTQQGPTYTVPKGRNCIITMCYGVITRWVVVNNDAGFRSNTEGFISIHSVAVNSYARPFDLVLSKSGPVAANSTCMQVGDQVSVGFSGSILMVAGDDLRFWTDASSEAGGVGLTGSCEVIMSYSGTEYDA